MTQLVDGEGNIVVNYVYDAWGNHKVFGGDGKEIVAEQTTHIGNLNPIRYRGYYYDTETGFYYLQSRCYDPEVGRFVSMDDVTYADPETLDGLNLYSYCGDNPVMFTDRAGTSWWTDFWQSKVGKLLDG